MKYLVNKETKEHYIQPGMMVPYGPQYDEVEADADGWIPWNGVECPLPDESKCEVVLENGETRYLSLPANFKWGGIEAIFDVIAYRPILAEKEEWSGYVDADDDQQQVTAASILKSALGHMEDRAATYDSQGGERSMGKVVEIFNTLTGHELTDEQGWLFMICLKLVRSQQGGYRADSYEDGAAYFALGGESAAKERGKGGSAAIKREAEQPAEDMSDWRNWREGDRVEAIQSAGGGYVKGTVYTISAIDNGVVDTVMDSQGHDDNGLGAQFFRFHSRPAKELPRG